MAWDEVCLTQASEIGAPLLRFYSWTHPTTSFGYFQKHADVQAIERSHSLVRRPTGGGIVHHTDDWTYSIVFPPSAKWYRINAKESYGDLHRWIQAAFSSLEVNSQLNPNAIQEGPGSCFIGAEENDLLFSNKKLAGAAQRRNKDGFLIQGSIQPPQPFVARSRWEKAFLKTATDQWGIQWQEWTPTSTITTQASLLARSKYDCKKHTKRR